MKTISQNSSGGSDEFPAIHLKQCRKSLAHPLQVLNKASLKRGDIKLLLLLLKKVSSVRLGESDKPAISPKTPAPQYQPIDRKKRKGKRVEDYSRDRAA